MGEEVVFSGGADVGPSGVAARPFFSVINGHVEGRTPVEGDERFDDVLVRVDGSRPYKGEFGCLEDQIGAIVSIRVRRGTLLPEDRMLQDFVVERRADERNTRGVLFLRGRVPEQQGAAPTVR